MIIEGKHLAVGQGIFVSDIQDGSAAEQVISRLYECREFHFNPKFFTILQAGLKMGDMILAVNLDSLIGRTYDEVRIFFHSFKQRII